MSASRVSLARFLSAELLEVRDGAAGLASMIFDVVSALKTVSALIGRGALASLGDRRSGEAGVVPSTSLVTDMLRAACEAAGYRGVIAGHELGDLESGGISPWLLALEPLESASSLAMGSPAGTMFSVIRRPTSGAMGPSELLQPGSTQVCAGYALYGPATVVVLTLGRGVHGFTLDRQVGELVLTHRGLRLPAGTRSLIVDVPREQLWEPPLERWVAEKYATRDGPVDEAFRTRPVVSVVAAAHRLLLEGGVCVLPATARGDRGPRLLGAAAPMAMLIEQAGGAASTGRERLLDVAPSRLDERVSAFVGDRDEVAQLERRHRDHDAGVEPFRDPLFNVRSLFWAS
jgi:fructose-1,6-bisphosphatase I/sedoheptulose-1,7-bisphosphatase/fructose-1,6-bisphosphatase I